MRNAMQQAATLAAAIIIAGYAGSAKAGPCGENSCWKYTQSTAGAATAPADVLKVLMANKRSPAVAETLQRISLYAAAGVTPPVFVQQDHWQIGSFAWTGPTTCAPDDPRLATPPAFTHSYCLSNGACIPGDPAAPADKDPCAP
jgi:hypothetical protein